MRAEKRKKNAPKELSRLKSILKVDADVLMKDVHEIATVVVPRRAEEETQCEVKDDKGQLKKRFCQFPFVTFFLFFPVFHSLPHLRPYRPPAMPTLFFEGL